MFPGIDRMRDFWDFALRASAKIAGFSVLVLIALIFGILARESFHVVREIGILKFLTSMDWDPVFSKFGALPFIFGTLTTSLIAIFIALPLSIGIAIFLNELCPRSLRFLFSSLLELLAAIPSIVYGMWGLFVFAPFIAKKLEAPLVESLGFIPLFSGAPIGIGLLTAGIILAFMILPFISSVIRDAFSLVPDMVKESAYALGCTRWEVISGVVIPYTRLGIVGGTFLGLGRALGETMAITFVIGNYPRISWSLFEPAATITSVIANEFAEATEDIYISALVALAFILLVITFITLAGARIIIGRLTPKGEVVR